MSKDQYSLAELERLPNISEGHTGNLKVDTGEVRVWLERVGVADGMPYDNGVIVERLTDGCWTTECEYQAR